MTITTNISTFKCSRISNGRNLSFNITDSEDYQTSNDQEAANHQQSQDVWLVLLTHFGSLGVTRQNAAEGKDENKPWGKCVGHCRVEDEILTDEISDNADEHDADRCCRCIDDRLRLLIVDASNPNGEIEQCRQKQPGSINSQTVVNQSTDEPDVCFPKDATKKHWEYVTRDRDVLTDWKRCSSVYSVAAVCEWCTEVRQPWWASRK